MHLRRKKIVEVQVDDVEQCAAPAEGPGHPASGDTSMLGAVDRLNLFRAIRKLPAGYKKLFVMHDVIGYQHNEIAEMLGCSLGCSKSQLHRARKQLRRLLQGEQGTQVPA
jgi:RNA polymerase sigma-70 factor (ECF subfamily)